jgi:hypothetical protein
MRACGPDEAKGSEGVTGNGLPGGYWSARLFLPFPLLGEPAVLTMGLPSSANPYTPAGMIYRGRYS